MGEPGSPRPQRLHEQLKCQKNHSRDRLPTFPPRTRQTTAVELPVVDDNARHIQIVQETKKARYRTPCELQHSVSETFQPA